MSLMQNIKAAQLQARKDKNVIKANLLTTLIGEAASIGKNAGNRETTEAEIVAVIKKFIKNIDETLKVVNSATSQIERDILVQYLPAQLTEQELVSLVADIAANIGAATPKDMGKIMKVLKDQHDGQYDGALASKVIKQQLGG